MPVCSAMYHPWWRGPICQKKVDDDNVDHDEEKHYYEKETKKRF
jgi:hypothetical protein